MDGSRIPIGSVVEWTSQAGGFEKGKRGVVVAFVPAWESAVELAYEVGEKGPVKLMGQTVSAIDRYLVRVEKKRSVVYYTPRASLLEQDGRGKVDGI